MKNKTNWSSLQSILTICIIVLIFIYISYDAFTFRPKISKDVEKLKVEYKELNTYVNSKFPEIDSTLKIHTLKLQEQRSELNKLNEEIKDTQK